MRNFFLSNPELKTDVITIAIEALVFAAVLAVLFLTRRRSSGWLRAAERSLAQLGRRRLLSIALVGLLALTGTVTLSLVGHMPQPRVHDEFSYLLAADTFAHGRLSNPSHPLWTHFESLHVLQQPTYASKYPPAQGLMLAAGQMIGGHPIAGIWISTALACAALCWMLLAWLPPFWAILGSLLVALHPSILAQWGQSYWGGSVAMMGGALVFGAVRRIVDRPRAPDAVLLGLGVAVLANSRPYEGLVASLPVAVLLIAWMLGKNRPAIPVSMRQIIIPTASVLGLTALLMGFYNLRVTGDALRMPYLVHEAAYAMAPIFFWQSPRPEPVYRHDIIRYHHFRGLSRYRNQQSLTGLASEQLGRLRDTWKFYHASRGRLALTIPLFALPWVLRHSWPRFALLVCLMVAAALAMETYFFPHYAAPIMALVCVPVVQAMRHLYSWRRWDRSTGRFLVWATTVTAVLSFIVTFSQSLWVKPSGWGYERAGILTQLRKTGQRHLVLVPSKPLQSDFHHQEWVYNEADLNTAPVVWAREMDVPQNRRLIAHFKDRQVWRLKVNEDGSPPKLVPYSIEAQP